MAKKAQTKRKSKKNQDLVVVPSLVDPSVSFAVASELADDTIIEAELLGNTLPHFVYSFMQNGQDVTGLTVKGVNEVVRRLARNPKSGSKIRINPQYIKVEEVERGGQKGVQVSVYAEDLASGTSEYGIKFEPYEIVDRYGKTKENKFATEKALSKATRNAKRKLIPEVACVKMIKQLMKENTNSVIKLDNPPQQSYKTIDVSPAKIKPTTTEGKMQMIRTAIINSRIIDNVIEIDEKTTSSKEFSEAFKAEIHELAEARVARLEAK